MRTQAVKDFINEHQALIAAVAHDAFRQIDFSFVRNQSIILFDLKRVLPKELVEGRL
jgi:UDP-N-acetyl-D-galactosamine dehydrogenase